MEKITTFIEILQVLLPIYCLYRLIIDKFLYKIIVAYAIWVILFFILKLWFYVPVFWSFEDKIFWSIPNIIFSTITLFLIITKKKDDWLHRDI